MSTSPNADFAAQVEALVRERLAPLLRNNAALREQVARLQQINVELSRRLGVAPIGSEVEFSTRGGTLKLIKVAEDSLVVEQRAIEEGHKSENKSHEVNRENDEFLATLVHELKNPLAPLRSNTRPIRREGANDADAQRFQNFGE